MLRDKFAMAAMQAILSDAVTWKHFIQTAQKTNMQLNDVVAATAYEFADAMMREREKWDFSNDPDNPEGHTNGFDPEEREAAQGKAVPPEVPRPPIHYPDGARGGYQPQKSGKDDDIKSPPRKP
ncbi:hypothetical protein Alexa_046 [Acinetobacter phage vB_AbaP_Alexa]|nr:hypothetical protein Alexa_046 [Acinetobacter phage vB_AbaP_Alexa]